METIMVTEKQKDNIVRELARLKKILEKDRGIDCVYFSFFAPYTREGGSALVITLVTDNFDSYFIDHIGFYNGEYAQDDNLHRFGLTLRLDYDCSFRYTLLALNPSELRRWNYLFNAEILLDKSGVCTKIKQEMEKNEPSLNKELGIHYFPNLAEIYPPLEEKEKTKSSGFVKKKTR